MENKKLAFLFLIYDEILQEELWYNFFKNIDENKYSIYIHYKENKPLKFFEKFKLKQCIQTNYGDISLVYAQKLLLDEALKDKDNYKFMNISQSCIPLKSFNYIYKSLTYNDFSIFNEAPRNQSFPRCDGLLKFLPKEQIYKSSQWWILNRKYVEFISADKEYINYFNNIYAPEEHYFITLIKNKGSKEDLICTPNLAEGASTFTNWYDMIYPKKYLSKNQLKIYENISKEEIDYLIESPCFFGRKFKDNCKVEEVPIKEYLTNKLKLIESNSSHSIERKIEFYCIHPSLLKQRDNYVQNLRKNIESIGYNFNIFDGVSKSSIFIEKDILQNEIINFEFNSKKEKILFDNQRNTTEFNRKLSQGEISCMLSHFLLWKNLEKNNNKLFFILEDDANINISKDQFKLILDNIPDSNSFDICYFNDRQEHKVKNKINEYYYEVDNGRVGHLWDQMFNGADGYLLTNNGLKKVIDIFSLYCNADGFLHRWINEKQPKVISSYVKPISIIENIPSMIWS